MVKRTPAYKNKLKALELERTGAMSSKKKGGYKIDKYATIHIYCFCYVDYNFMRCLIFLWTVFYDRKMQEDLSKELELQIKGAEKPSMWGLLVVRFILLPYTLGKVVYYIL